MKRYSKKIVSSLVVLSLLVIPSTCFAQAGSAVQHLSGTTGESLEQVAPQPEGMVIYEDYLNPGEVLELPAMEVPRPPLGSTRSWDQYDFDFEGYNCGTAREYYGSRMGVEVYVTQLGSYIGSATHVQVHGPGLEWIAPSMTVASNGMMHKLDNIPIQNGGKYYLTYLNQAPVHVTVIIYTW